MANISTLTNGLNGSSYAHHAMNILALPLVKLLDTEQK